MRPHVLILVWASWWAAALIPLGSAAAQEPLATHPPCQLRSATRGQHQQAELLRGMIVLDDQGESREQVVSVNFHGARRGAVPIPGMHLREGLLVAPSMAPTQLDGIVLPARLKNGQLTEVAVCEVMKNTDSHQGWYRIEFWNARTSSWQQPCAEASDGLFATPVPGIWDESGARNEQPDSFTFACHGGAIAMCIEWGYAPWVTREGHSLKDLHQACTRMVRADYCGDGQSHTASTNRIDIYDNYSIQTRMESTTLENGWRFGAEWGPDGARCVANTRTGAPLASILATCSNRFHMQDKDLGLGDRCKAVREGEHLPEWLREWNHEPSAPAQGP